jgi:ribosome-binding protein aMBF1 (putative translation factor)
MSRADEVLRERWVLNLEHPWREIVEDWRRELGISKWRLAHHMGIDPRQLQRWLNERVEPRPDTMQAVFRALAEIQAEKENSSKARYLSPPHLPYIIRPTRAPRWVLPRRRSDRLGVAA